jgi:flagellar basal-body rod protein FlgB
MCNPETLFYEVHMYGGKKMTETNAFARTLKQALGKPDSTFTEEGCETHTNFCQDPFFVMKGKKNETTDGCYSDAIDIDIQLMHLMENNITYRSTTRMLLQKMTTLTHAIDRKGK